MIEINIESIGTSHLKLPNIIFEQSRCKLDMPFYDNFNNKLIGYLTG